MPAGHHGARFVEEVRLALDLQLAIRHRTGSIGIKVVPLLVDVLPARALRAVATVPGPRSVTPLVPAGDHRTILVEEVVLALDLLLAALAMAVLLGGEVVPLLVDELPAGCRGTILVEIRPRAVGPLVPAGHHGTGGVEAVHLALDLALATRESAPRIGVEVVPLLVDVLPTGALRAVCLGVGPLIVILDLPAGRHRAGIVVEVIGLAVDFLFAAGGMALVLGVEVIQLTLVFDPALVSGAEGVALVRIGRLEVAARAVIPLMPTSH